MLIWEKKKGYMTPGGDPLWECPNCTFTHCYGVEAVSGPYHICPRCHKVIGYPWDKEKVERLKTMKIKETVSEKKEEKEDKIDALTIIKKLRKSDRYRNFIFFDRSASFKEVFRDMDYPIVQVHDMTPVGDGIVGFAGQFKWENNTLTSLDGDSYNDNISIWGYGKFESDRNICLDILSDNW